MAYQAIPLSQTTHHHHLHSNLHLQGNLRRCRYICSFDSSELNLRSLWLRVQKLASFALVKHFSHFQKSLPPPQCRLSTMVETPILGVLEIAIIAPTHGEVIPINDLGTLTLVIQNPYSLLENSWLLSLEMIKHWYIQENVLILHVFDVSSEVSEGIGDFYSSFGILHYC